MTTDDIETRIEAIRNAANEWDFEAAHSLEDELMHDFIEYIASLLVGSGSLRAKAVLVLSTKDIDFIRVTA